MKEKLARPKAFASCLAIAECFPPTPSDDLISSNTALKVCQCTPDEAFGDSFRVGDQVLEFRPKRRESCDQGSHPSQMMRLAKFEARRLYEFLEALPRDVRKVSALRIKESLEYGASVLGVLPNDLDGTKDITRRGCFSASFLVN
jgi:hypothetical protein